mmetsp:Transcript_35954/g.47306  ORF Transcript_35954/g.47306 Transcript_35954/m.47306 type:complete len:93 (-) Transcript_35954:482-760(-)
MVACLDRMFVKKRLIIYRLYSLEDEKNKLTSLPLPQGNAHGLKQFHTEYMLVLCDNKIMIFNIIAGCLQRTVEFQGMFQRAILVDPFSSGHS